jgi:hypothetical protein
MKQIFDAIDEAQLRSLYQSLWDKAMADPVLERITREAIASDCDRDELFSGAWTMGACFVLSEILKGNLKQRDRSPSWQSKN